MGEKCYKINEIPDLSLSKYSYLSEKGVKGVLKLHNTFLWLLHEKSRLSNLCIHLLYIYNSEEKSPSKKINIFLVFSGDEKNLENTNSIVQGSSISNYFNFEFLYFKDNSGNIVETAIDNLPESISDKKKNNIQNEYNSTVALIDSKMFSYCSCLNKEEVFFSADNGRHFHNAPVWKPNEEGRLYEMFRLMHNLNENCAFRIDIKAEKVNRELRKDLKTGPIQALHGLISGYDGLRDYGADAFLRSYEDVMKAFDTSPHFRANFFAFGNNSENASLLLSAAASEAIKEGDYNIVSYNDSYSAASFIAETDISIQSKSNDNTYSFIKKNNEIGSIVQYNDYMRYGTDEEFGYLNTLYTLEELAPLFRLPCLFDGEEIDIAKETVAPYVESDDALYLGMDVSSHIINFPLKLFTKHAFISGVPGSGKTNTMHHITHSLWTDYDIPFLVLEPAKKEYRALCNCEEEKMKELRLYSPGMNTKFPIHINPFEFPKGLTVSEHIGMLCEVFEGAFPLENPTPFLLENAIEAVYVQCGWRMDSVYTDNTVKPFPTMSMLYKQLEKEMAKTEYSGEVRGNIESAIKVRIGSLLRREMGDVFDVPISSVPPEKWIETPAVIELESMGQGPANFLTLMLCSLIREVLKVSPPHKGKKPRHILFIEEAHNLIGPESEEKRGNEANSKSAATAFIVKMLAEVRALGEGVVIADQLPTAMADEVIKNTGLKIALRMTSSDDRSLIGNSMSANSSQIEELGNYDVGDALVFYEGLRRPFKMRINRMHGDKSEKEIERLITPLNNNELFERMKNYPSYHRQVVASADAIYDKFRALINAYSDNVLAPAVSEYENMIDLLNQKEKAINNCEKLKAVVDEALHNSSDTKETLEYEPWIDEAEKSIEVYNKLAETLDNNYEQKLAANRSLSLKVNGLIEIALNLFYKMVYLFEMGVKMSEESGVLFQNKQYDKIKADERAITMIDFGLLTEIIEKAHEYLDLAEKSGYDDINILRNKVDKFAAQLNIN